MGEPTPGGPSPEVGDDVRPEGLFEVVDPDEVKGAKPEEIAAAVKDSVDLRQAQGTARGESLGSGAGQNVSAAYLEIGGTSRGKVDADTDQGESLNGLTGRAAYDEVRREMTDVDQGQEHDLDAARRKEATRQAQESRDRIARGGL